MLLLLFGRMYATPLDMITPLDKPRRLIGILAMVVFLLIFVPAPLTATSYASTPQPPVSTGPRAAVIQSLPLDFSTLLSSTLNGQ